MRSRKLVFYLTYACSANCFFCGARQVYVRHGKRLNPSWDDVRRGLAERKRNGCDFVLFTGGEPTESPLFPKAVRLARDIGLRTGVNTNLLRFSDPTFCDETLMWLDEINGAVHGPSAAVHDLVLRTAGAFERLEKALRNIDQGRASRDFRLLTNTVMNTLNLSHLGETLEFLLTFRKIRRIIFSNAALPPAAPASDLDLVPRLSDLAGIVDVLAAHPRPNGVSLSIEGVPLCILGRHRVLSADLFFESHEGVIRDSTAEGIVSKHVVGTDPRERAHSPRCRECAYLDLCRGVNSFYLEYRGDRELRPVAMTPAGLRPAA